MEYLERDTKPYLHHVVDMYLMQNKQRSMFIHWNYEVWIHALKRVPEPDRQSNFQQSKKTIPG